MAKKTKKPTKATKPPVQEDEKPPAMEVEGVDSAALVAQLDTWVGESKGEWDKRRLDAITKENFELYNGEQVSKSDDGSEDKALDNRIFSSVETIIPFVTTRITEPEVLPSSLSDSAKSFAQDFEKALHNKATRVEMALDSKITFALQDAMIARRGYLKPRYDPVTNDWFHLEYVPAESIIIDHVAKPYEEPRYFRHVLMKSVDDLILMFPDKEARIKELFGITDKSNPSDYKVLQELNEDWTMYRIGNELDLLVCWNIKQEALGVIKDPNWRYEDTNFTPYHMMPLIFFNVLSDGRTHVDRTSFVEQAKYSQKTVDKRSEQITENAGLGSVGMPVVKSGALAEDQSQFLKYEKDTVLELDVPEDQSINDVFTKWQANPLTPEVYKDKADAIEAVGNAFGASNINQGIESDNATLGQDVLLRDESRGRQQKIVKAIDRATSRMDLLRAQFLLVYGDESVLFPLTGENSKFDYIIMNTAELDTDAYIRVKGGTNMPIDRSQRRATADTASQRNMIDPLTYWEIMDEPNAEKYAKRVADWTRDPLTFMADMAEEVFNRDAYVDIHIIKAGGTPPYREDLPKDYFDYLNKFSLSGALAPENPNLAMPVKQAIVAFINQQLARGQKMLGMLETQLPTPQDVNDHNAQQDAANEADAAAQPKGGPGQGANQPQPQGAVVE